ncbi:hypothetical protein [Desulfovibrio ferrophilus]|uniref:Uncharacterized protein n=1 Tax=Desulfovibrio ferrophilus TaxID=241368 RepID=A0A2Z6AZ10_9BACT|nr:hypothetical protein [Desulfovibrio ferrophilus]BBD08415.1 uncharacterized protein DFE_1689 [Desulfovibrio ferrophilus]
MLDRPKETLIRAGELFMYTVWIQCQMSDLVILRNNPDKIKAFISTPERVPNELHLKRAAYWEKLFKNVMGEFFDLFEDDITKDEKKLIEYIHATRNAIAHSHVSLGRDYHLYRPAGGKKKEEEIKRVMNLQSIKDKSDPMMVLLPWYDDEKYLYFFKVMKFIDEITFERLSSLIGVPHSRIR